MFFIYYNWRAKRNIGTLHVGSCGNCKNGKGKHPNAVQGINGEWSKAHNTIKSAEAEVKNKNYNAEYCRCIKKS